MYRAFVRSSYIVRALFFLLLSDTTRLLVDLSIFKRRAIVWSSVLLVVLHKRYDSTSSRSGGLSR